MSLGPARAEESGGPGHQSPWREGWTAGWGTTSVVTGQSRGLKAVSERTTKLSTSVAQPRVMITSLSLCMILTVLDTLGAVTQKKRFGEYLVLGTNETRE